MAFNNKQQDQTGIKSIQRFDITMRIIDAVDAMGNLYESLRFDGITNTSARNYRLFTSSFFKIFHMTATLLKPSEKNISLVADTEGLFQGEILPLTPDKASAIMAAWENYLFALQEAGIYDPSIIHKYDDPSRAWEGSI